MANFSFVNKILTYVGPETDVFDISDITYDSDQLTDRTLVEEIDFGPTRANVIKYTRNGLNALSDVFPNIKTVILPLNFLSELGDSIFANLKHLESAQLSSMVRKIGDYCFMNCEKLTTCFCVSGNLFYDELPFALERIGKQCFYGCNSLGKDGRSLLIYPRLKYIGGQGGTFVGTLYKGVVFDDFDSTFLEEFDNNIFSPETTIQFYKINGLLYDSTTFIYNQDEKSRNKWFTSRYDRNCSVYHYNIKDMYYLTENPKYLTDIEFKYMIKTLRILTEEQIAFLDRKNTISLINQLSYNQRTDNVTVNDSVASIKTVLYIGFGITLFLLLRKGKSLSEF